ncbi:MAG: PD-(D/E)XK nuclease family transposase [Candidatus Omnitrophota bacterium]
MLTSLESETIFREAFTDKAVFMRFVKDILDIDFVVDKIETEKKFELKDSDKSVSYDIFAESVDHRVVVEIKRVDYDSNFDRFLHYHMMAIAELQRSSSEYRIEKTVYTIVVITAPYKIEQKTGLPVLDEVLISSVDPRNLQDKVVNLYGHKLVFLNSHYVTKDTPQKYRDWLELVYQSAHNPNDFKVNLENEGIRKVIELIDYDNLSPELRTQMKIDNQRRATLKIVENQSSEKTKIEMILKMKAEGINSELISRVSGFSIEEIEKLGS